MTAFHPAVATWFERRFPHGPTEAQAQGWPAIAAGENTLIAAPTGSGKTLSAFLVCIDRLYRAAETGAQPAEDEVATQVVYVSPLKALAVDIQQNLQKPLAEIAEVAQELGLPAPDIRVAVRSGDTNASARSAMLKKPPHILITTPESLYLLLTAKRSREIMRSVRTVIVDEIHALARDKRGAHLAISLERLQYVAGGMLTRIGLSATQRPIERVSRLLCGRDEAGAPRPCTIVDTGHRRAIDLAIELPGSALEAVASKEQTAEVLDRIARLVSERRTTLVFVNTRRLSERIAHLLAERLGEDKVAAHHGSLSKERRLRVEERLRAGDLRAVVATASLELGIDVGPVELVCQLGSPRSIATLLQRVGRSGHTRFGTPVGRLYPFTRDELVECAALLRALRAGKLDAIALPEAPLEVLAQQLVAECAAEERGEDELYALALQAEPFAALPRADFDAALELVSEGVQTGRGVRAAYLQRDRVNGRVKARRAARIAALTSGGTIPETGDYRVLLDPDDTFIGTVNEDFAIESMAGDVFLLGSSSWRIRRVERGVVRVTDAKGATPTVPFWLGEAPARTAELSTEVSELRAAAQATLTTAGAAAATDQLAQDAGIDPQVAAEVIAYLAASHAALGVLPTQQDLVFERFFDETAGMQLILHAPLGGRINRALGLLLRKRFCTSFDFELQAAANDDSVVLSLGPQHSFPLDEAPAFLRPQRAREALVHASLVTPMFGARFRWNLTRALVVLRFKGGKKNPPPIQRMESDDVMVAVFPALAACQDNATGPRVIPDHLLVRQTIDDCLNEAMDIRAVESLLDAIASGEVRLHFRDTTEPSPLSHEILNSRPYTFLDDAPLEERRTRAVQLRRGLPVEQRALAALDPAAIDRVRAEAEPQPRDADELHDLLLAVGVARPRQEWDEWFEALVAQGRAHQVAPGEAALWCVRERRATCDLLFPSARYAPDLPALVLPNPPADREHAARDVVRGHLDIAGPLRVPDLCERTALDADTVRLALIQLEGEGFAMRGRFDPRVTDPTEPEYCARRLLARVHAYTQERLRREIEPVTAQDYMRFLLQWQHVDKDARLSGPAGVLRVVEQLQGFELAASAWESQIFAARVEGYRPEWLDALCLSGQVVWGRLARSAPRTDAQALPPLPAERTRPGTLSRATPITLAIRADFQWLALAATGERGATPPLDATTAQVLALLRERGASFFSELRAGSGLSADALREALWDGVARGLVTADGYGALRALLARSSRFSNARALEDAASPLRLRRGASPTAHGEGRWALVPEPAALRDIDALAEAVAEQLLARWGVIFRDLLARESLGLPMREISYALRRLEARGVIRGGRFVTGFSGEQYAMPEAVELLRKVRKQPRDGKLVQVSGSDPCNLTGIVLPGARVPALRTYEVTFRDGLMVSEGEQATGA